MVQLDIDLHILQCFLHLAQLLLFYCWSKNQPSAQDEQFEEDSMHDKQPVLQGRQFSSS